MTVAIDAILSVALLLTGYVYTCNYLSGAAVLSLSKATLKITRKRALYFVIGMVVAGVLIALFEKLYFLSMVSQVKLLSLALLLLPVAVIDFYVQKIPNQLLIAAIVIRVIVYAVEFFVSVSAAVGTLKDNLLGAVIIGVFFLLLRLTFKNSIGMGDVKLFAVLGIYQGLWGAINSVFFSLLVSFVVSVVLLITKKKGRKDTISFGPSIFVGTVVAMGLAGM